MNNYSLMSADKSTHLKIVVVSLFAAIVVVAVGLAARPNLSESTAVATTANGKIHATGPVIRAGKPLTITSSDTTAIR